MVMKKITKKKPAGSDFTDEFVEPAPPKHARRAASTSHRWTVCTASLQHNDGRPDGGNAAAILGTGAHALAEKFVMANKSTCEEMLGKEWKFKYDDEEKTCVVDSEMVEGVDVLLQLVQKIKKTHPQSTVHTEVRVNLEWVYKQMFGTTDVVIDCGDVLHVIDFKYGFTPVPLYDRERWDTNEDGLFRHVETMAADYFKPIGMFGFHQFSEAQLNSQLLYYAAGCLHVAAWLHREVRVYVVQPRCFELPSVQVASLPADYVEQWAVGFLRQKAIETDTNPQFVPGDHCDWCPGMLDCEAVKSRTQAVARMEFAEVVEADTPMPAAPKEQAAWSKAVASKLPMPTDPKKLSDILRWVPILDAFCKLATEQAMNLINTGVEVPGFKLVRKRSNRDFGDLSEDQSEVIEVDDAEVIKRLKAAAKELKIKLPAIDDLYHPPKLKSPAQMEELGKDVKKIVAQVAVKPLGGLTLAIASDNREAVVKKPGADFKDVTEDFL